jgi:prolyl-tRNA editing enzyme YbaK/EbsC (Cys-tRNA(Pro) deacylase)
MSTTADDGVDAVKDALTATESSARVCVRKAAPKSVDDKVKAFKVQPGAIVRAEIYTVGGEPVLALLSGARRCREDQLPRIFFMKGAVKRAKADAVRRATGFSAGGLGPVGHKRKLRTAIDVALKGHETLIAQAGAPHAFLELDMAELKRLTGGIVSYALAEDA